MKGVVDLSLSSLVVILSLLGLLFFEKLVGKTHGSASEIRLNLENCEIFKKLLVKTIFSTSNFEPAPTIYRQV